MKIDTETRGHGDTEQKPRSFIRRVSTVGEAVTRDKPGEREMFELVQKAAARNR